MPKSFFASVSTGSQDLLGRKPSSQDQQQPKKKGSKRPNKKDGGSQAQAGLAKISTFYRYIILESVPGPLLFSEPEFLNV
jgi:hypothetical protein